MYSVQSCQHHVYTSDKYWMWRLVKDTVVSIGWSVDTHQNLDIYVLRVSIMTLYVDKCVSIDIHVYWICNEIVLVLLIAIKNANTNDNAS